MEIEQADFVLIVFTETYHRRATNREQPGIGRDVSWEGAIIRNELYQAVYNNNKFVPVLLDAADEQFILKPLQGGTHYVVDRPSLEDSGYQSLVRYLLNRPAIEMP